MNNPTVTDPTLELLRDALQIADQSATSLIQGECLLVMIDGTEWYDTRTAETYTKAWQQHYNYLRARGLLIHHKVKPGLITMKVVP